MKLILTVEYLQLFRLSCYHQQMEGIKLLSVQRRYW